MSPNITSLYPNTKSTKSILSYSKLNFVEKEIFKKLLLLWYHFII